MYIVPESIKVKVKFSLEQATKAQKGSRCIALLFLQPRRQMWVGGQRHAPAALTAGKTRYPLYRRLGRPQGRSGRVRKISPPPGFDPPTVQLVASRYTDSSVNYFSLRSDVCTKCRRYETWNNCQSVVYFSRHCIILIEVPSLHNSEQTNVYPSFQVPIAVEFRSLFFRDTVLRVCVTGARRGQDSVAVLAPSETSHTVTQLPIPKERRFQVFTPLKNYMCLQHNIQENILT